MRGSDQLENLVRENQVGGRRHSMPNSRLRQEARKKRHVFSTESGIPGIEYLRFPENPEITDMASRCRHNGTLRSMCLCIATL